MYQSVRFVRPLEKSSVAKYLGWALGGIFFVHFLELLVFPHQAIAVSRSLTAAMALTAAGCALVRSRWVSRFDRPNWMWAATGISLWAIAHAVETGLYHSNAASVLSVDASDFIYLSAFFPLLLAFSTTRETQALRTVFLLNCAQIGLALVLAYVLLYRMALTQTVAETVMARIYGIACLMLAVMSLLRSLCWATREERQCIRWISFFVWTYLPIELGMDYLTGYHGLTAGTLLDLSWSLPFGLAGWKALTLPLEDAGTQPIMQATRIRLLVECVCPLLMNAAIFALAASVIRQHFGLGIGAICAVLALQGVQAAVVQMNYLSGRKLLLQREQDLRTANVALEQLTLLDPLTGIANRRRFDAALEMAWRRAVRHRQPLALMMVDVDFFKGVNDLHGHGYGDECLISIARVMSSQARRPDDLVARMGGEEFVLLLPDTEQPGARVVTERLHEEIRQLGIVNDASPFSRTLTVSIGTVICHPHSGITPHALMELADQALYSAKALGRNQTKMTLLR